MFEAFCSIVDTDTLVSTDQLDEGLLDNAVDDDAQGGEGGVDSSVIYKATAASGLVAIVGLAIVTRLSRRAHQSTAKPHRHSDDGAVSNEQRTARESRNMPGYTPAQTTTASCQINLHSDHMRITAHGVTKASGSGPKSWWAAIDTDCIDQLSSPRTFDQSDPLYSPLSIFHDGRGGALAITELIANASTTASPKYSSQIERPHTGPPTKLQDYKSSRAAADGGNDVKCVRVGHSGSRRESSLPPTSRLVKRQFSATWALKSLKTQSNSSSISGDDVFELAPLPPINGSSPVSDDHSLP